MLLKQTHFPDGNNNSNVGAVVLALIVITGIGYLTYQSYQTSKIITKPKNDTNE